MRLPALFETVDTEVRKQSRTWPWHRLSAAPRGQVTAAGPLSRVGHVSSRASSGESVFDDICAKIQVHWVYGAPLRLGLAPEARQALLQERIAKITERACRHSA